MENFSLTKVKVCFYIVHIQSVGPLKVFYTSPRGKHVHSRTNLPTVATHSRFQHYRYYSQAVGRYSFIQLSELGHHGEYENAQTSKR